MTILEIAENQLCCGCGLCAAVEPDAFRMEDVPSQGVRPVADGPVADTEGHRLAVETCPGLNLRHERAEPAAGEIASIHDVWGPCLEVWEGYAGDEAIRFRGSSGGVATALAAHGLATGETGGVLHIAAGEDRPLVNETVLSRTPEELLERTGSRYAPAAPCEGLGRLADEEKPVVFIGKPCDVAGVTQLARRRPDVAEKVALTVGIFCAGTPSSDGTRLLLEKMGVVDPDGVLSMRYRGDGWPGEIVVVERLADGTEAERRISYEEGWGLLSKHRQWRCLICPDHSGEFADIAVGDPWYREIAPGEPGQSLILARTERGRAFLERAIAAGAVVAERVDPSLVTASQAHLRTARASIWGRLAALWIAGVPTPRFVRMRVWANWRSVATTREKLVSVVGTLRRLKVKRLLRPVPVEPAATRTAFTRHVGTEVDSGREGAA